MRCAFLIEADPAGVLKNGPVNDIYAMAGRLIDLGYTKENLFLYQQGSHLPIARLKEPVASAGLSVIRSRDPLREIRRILDSLKWEVDHVLIGISGDGHQVKDKDGDEADGRDEVIGTIVDDDIFALLQKFHATTSVWLLTDSCHSGTLSDLPVIWAHGEWKRHSKRKPETDPRATVIGMSAVSDSLCVMSEYGDWYGGAIFLHAVKEDVVKHLVQPVTSRALHLVRQSFEDWFKLLHSNASKDTPTIGNLVLTASHVV